jgi:cell division septation protein DedD
VAQTQDDGFHEIQLSGKQLAFLVMAATVVSVVIFLFGVLVGRGVRAERGTLEATAATGVEPTPAPAGPSAPPVGQDPTKAVEPPAPAAEPAPVDEGARKPSAPVAEKTADKPVDTPAKPHSPDRTAPPPPPPPAPMPTTGGAHGPTEPAGSGYAVQIAALNVRSEADAIAKRLTSKGYSAYVLAPASGSPSVFRVRVGKFQTRREAETVAAKLQKEEQYRPWVTR